MEAYCGFQMTNGDYICHHGVKGQKWGRRRYQNLDGSLINGGNKRLQQKAVNKGYAFSHKGNYYMTNKQEHKTIAKNRRAARAKFAAATGIAVAGMAAMTHIGAHSSGWAGAGKAAAAGALAGIGVRMLTRSIKKNGRNINNVRNQTLKRHGVKLKKPRVYV